MTNQLILVLVAVAIAILGFLILRAMVLWYWRVNEQIALLKNIDEKLGRMVDKEPYVRATFPSSGGIRAYLCMSFGSSSIRSRAWRPSRARGQL